MVAETEAASTTSPVGPGRILRSIGAILAGVIAVVALSIGTDALMVAVGIFPSSGAAMSDALFVLAMVYRTVYSILGAYIAARLAPSRPMLHALVIGFIGLAAGVAGAIAARNAGAELGPQWYSIAIFIIALPTAWLGGRLRTMQLNPRADS